MSEKPFTPADPEEVRQAIAHALRYNRRGKPTQEHMNFMAEAAAMHLVEALRLNNFVIMRGAPAPNHAGTPPPHATFDRPAPSPTPPDKA